MPAPANSIPIELFSSGNKLNLRKIDSLQPLNCTGGMETSSADLPLIFRNVQPPLDVALARSGGDSAFLANAESEMKNSKVSLDALGLFKFDGEIVHANGKSLAKLQGWALLRCGFNTLSAISVMTTVRTLEQSLFTSCWIMGFYRFCHLGAHILRL